jgi:SAM-dependent methyltransferase
MKLGVSEYEPSTYGDRIADVYDAWRTLPADTHQAVEFLASLAGPGPVLELGIGTGRIALPLVERGLAVHGIDASEAMVARLRAKTRGDQIPVTMGDFTDVRVDGTFELVYVVFNTFFAPLTQEDQVRCMTNVAAHLSDGGSFVLEAFVPDLSRFDHGQRVGATHVGLDEVVLEVSVHHPETQHVDSQQLVIREGAINAYPVRIRYAWPSELDLMARLAGLRLRERWGGWRREPFEAGSAKHISVYELERG